jgi:hypothetical protein
VAVVSVQLESEVGLELGGRVCVGDIIPGGEMGGEGGCPVGSGSFGSKPGITTGNGGKDGTHGGQK